MKPIQLLEEHLKEGRFDPVLTNRIPAEVAKLIALGPYVAKAPNPERLARIQLGMVKADVENPGVYDLTPGEDVADYLSMMFKIPGGRDTPALRHRNALLTIMAIQDQFTDRGVDKLAKKANIFEGLDDAQANVLRDGLIQEQVAIVDANPDADVASVMTASQAVAYGIWSV